MRIKAFICLILIVASLVSCSPKEKKESSPHTLSFYEYFDTVCTVSSYSGESASDFGKNAEFVKGELDRYHKLFDIYNTYEGVNNIKTINDNAGVSAVTVSNELISFLQYAKHVYNITDGVLNIALGSVLTLWHNCRTQAIEMPENASVPTKEYLENADRHTDINNLIIDEKASTVYISDPNMSLNVGALGKGYATEKIANKLESQGVTSYVLNMGGNIRAIGAKPSGDGWVTGITNPNKSASASQFIAKTTIKDTSIVTSGNYERYYTVNGVNYHHIIDPDTLEPSRYFSSVSVMTKDSALADALSTALFCMSYEEGLELINKLGGVEVLWVKNDFSIITTAGFELYSKDGK